ncbi:MAG: hypothetical protein NTW68_07305 [candidate division NC10 bacterium]|nr:hypothetical protein [candidate division NC10 bacterium]
MNQGSRRATLWPVAFLALLLLAWSAPPSAEGQQIHGENSSFLGQGVAMVWGVLRGVREEDTQAVLRIVPAGGEYAAVSVEGVDPFSGTRQDLQPRRPLSPRMDVWSLRSTFADLPRREIHFYAKDDGQVRPPALTVYFMGLPDTTPEFGSEAALLGYLDQTLEKLLSGKGRTP